jgi:hypothetical protein
MAPDSGYILLCALLYENLLILSLPSASLNCVALALLTLPPFLLENMWS